MDTRPARIRLSIPEGLLEIEGSEEFVAQQIAALKDVVVTARPVLGNGGTPGKQPETAGSKPEATGGGSPTHTAGKIEDYPHLYAIDAAGALHITKELPGKSTPEKVVSATLLYLYGRKLKGDSDEAFFKDIGGICGEHGCLDKANFAGHVKTAAPKLVTVSGGGQGAKLSAKLTFTGTQEARKLADQLNGQ